MAKRSVISHLAENPATYSAIERITGVLVGAVTVAFLMAAGVNDARDSLRVIRGETAPDCRVLSVVRPMCR